MLRTISILCLFVTSYLGSKCPSPIIYMEPPICTNNVGPIGLEKAYDYAVLLFGDIHNYVNDTEKDCILNGDAPINKNIQDCIDDLTIHNNSNGVKLAKGLALNNDSEWVSACAEHMPCIDFNTYVENGTFTQLVKSCGAESVFEKLFSNTHFIECSWYGVKYCQHLYPKECLYLERESCSNVDYLYGCAVSRWVYASNFMLFYILDPKIAARLPNCRIIY